MSLWDRQPNETPKAFAAFSLYRDLPAIDRTVQAALDAGRKKDAKGTHRGWQRWAANYDWRNRAAEHDSDLAGRRRERMAKELERAQDEAVTLVRAALAKVKERVEGMEPEELAAGQIPDALKKLIELEFKALGQDDRLAVKHEGNVEHVFQPTAEVWDEILAKRAAFEALRDDAANDTADGP